MPAGEPLAGRSNLLSLIDSERDSVVGTWKLDDSGLAFDRAEGASSLQIPVDVPEEYRLNLELERRAGTDSFVIGLPIGGVMTIVVLDGASGRTYGLNALDGKPFENNELTGQGPVLPEGNLHKLTCVVRKRELVVECDGRRLIGWSGDPVRLAASFTTWIVPRADRPFIGGWQTGFRIRRLELAPVEDSASASAVQLVVGTGPGELSDLKGAFELARPGDTILIRHRGPLEFSATDLTGKTPLTIVGDRSTDGIDFWPVLRQAPRPVHPGRVASSETDAAGLFHAENLQLTLRRVHLAVGGPNRPPLQAVFSLAGGRVELDGCTVTVGIAAEEKGSVDATFPLVRAGGQSVELALAHSFVRGSRLEGCLAVRGSPDVNVVADNFLWAGGPAPWLSARELTGRLNVTLDRSTLYNLSSFVDWQPSGLSVDVPPAPANLAARNSLFVGAYANSAPLLAWNAANKQPDLPRAVAEKRVVFQGTDNVFHRFAGYYVDPKKKERADIAKWRSLWGRSATTDAREGDPQFRVWPADALVEECTPRDLLPRFARQKQRAREFDFPLGANPADLPPALARLFDRPAPSAGDLSAANLAASPRGVPRVLIVHQKNGPHKTLEGAFAEAQNDDIIEIADDATYAPRRNFSVAQAKAVLSSPAENLTLRAAEGRHPVIILRDELQHGKLPVFHPDGAPRDMGLFLLEGNGASLQLDGLHFRVALTKGSPHGIVFAPVTYLRVTNCSGIDFSGAPAVLVNAYDPVRFLYHAGVAGWFENLLLHAPSTFDGTIRPAGATETLVRLESRNAAGEYQIRNCVFSGGGIALKVQAWEANFTRNLSIGHSTFVGQVAYLTSPKDLAVNCQDNLVLCVANPFLAEPPLPPAGLANRGAHNALWLTSRPLTADERNADANALLPGPLLRLAPVPEGASTPKDPLKRYRLKRGQPAATLATDGGPAGVRTDFFPELPALPNEFFQ
ncbi:MAG TPA: hypothetical protein VL475_04950 [Planctomycetaceae bacterium]|nr:hypothetical protein [Planctomycetaceae bacterium]